jgi:type II secretory pathway pseudopilin PulG
MKRGCVKVEGQSRITTIRGFSLFELLISIAIGMSLLAVGGSVLVQIAKSQYRTISTAQINTLHRAMINMLASDQSWTNTLQSPRNPGMACLYNGNQCTPGVPSPFVLYDTGNAVYFDSTNPSNGFNANGESCAAFSNSGNDSCPFRFAMTWTAVCIRPACATPQVMISAKLLYAPRTGSLGINVENYSIASFYRNPPVTQLCGSANGAYLVGLPTTNLCTTGAFPSAVTGTGPWTWSCFGSGNSESCSSNVPINGICGPSNGQTFTVAPTSGLCSAGSPPASASGSGPWAWSCLGLDGGTTASCAALAPVNCVGAWSACSPACGAGMQIFMVTTPASGGGASCPAANGQTQACNTVCAQQGNWSPYPGFWWCRTGQCPPQCPANLSATCTPGTSCIIYSAPNTPGSQKYDCN